MSSITVWHLFRAALIVSLSYLLVCEIIYSWYSSGSANGFLIGGLLLTNLLMPSWLLFGRNTYYATQSHSTYLGCENESVSIDATRALIEVQAEIGITVFCIFFCIFLPIYITFIFTKLFNRHSLRQQPLNNNLMATKPLLKPTLIYCLYYLLVCEAIFWSINAVWMGFGLILLLLFSILTSPSTLILDIYGFRTREFSIQYLGCQSESTFETYGFIIHGQTGIFNSLMLLFFLIFLTKYCIFIARSLTMVKKQNGVESNK